MSIPHLSSPLSATASPGLWLHRSSTPGRLAQALAGVLAVPLPDPFATDIVSVSGSGVERWLSQTLATCLGAAGAGDGVAAGIDFTRPDRLLRGIVNTTLGIDPTVDPWHPKRGVWGLLAVLDASADEPWAALLGGGWDAALPGSRRFVTAARVFALFQAYAENRPAMLRRWRAGESVDGCGEPLDERSTWQAELWRALRAELGGPDPVERTDRAARLLAGDSPPAGLPQRLSLFGPPRLSRAQIAVLRALGRHRPVHVWLPHPSPVLWDTVAGAAAAYALGPRRCDPTPRVPRHRLNRRLARDARELQLALIGSGAIDVPADEPAAGAASLLHRLQAAIRADVADPARHRVDRADDSLRLHSCHGPDRQVEVLREVVLGVLSDHPEREPRDIAVLCPDLPTFAPLIAAAFALDGMPGAHTHPGQGVRVRLADRSLLQLNPLLGTLSALLGLGQSRAGATEILSLCAEPPVARRFGFSDTDLDRLSELVAQSGARWGLDQSHRQRFGMGAFGQNTWAAGLRRMLLGVALDDHDLTVRGTVLPLAAVESSDVDLVGRLAELLARLGRIVGSFTGPRTLPDWVAACRAALDLVTAVPAAETWQLTHTWNELAQLAESAAARPGEPEPLLSPGDIRAVLAERLAGRPGRSGFGTGAVTVCSLESARSVAHRVVILLGLDDGVFPRRGRLDGDDLLAAEPWVGDPDPRSTDRQTLLDAVLAAEEQLIVIASRASAQTGEPRPASVPLAELRAAVEDLCLGDPWPLLERRHPLQPFDPGDFQAAPGEGAAFSFDPVAARAATALRRTLRGPAPPPAPVFDDTPLPIPPELTAERVGVDLGGVLSFFTHPARDLLRRRAQLYARADTDPGPADEIPIQPDGLHQWAIGERMLRACLAGADLDAIKAAEFCRGDIPPGRRGQQLLEEVEHRVRAIHRQAAPWLGQTPADSRWIAADLGRWQLTGLVLGLHDTTLVRLGYGSLSGRQRLQSWIELLALTASRPGVAWRAVTIGRSGHGTVLGPVAEADARARLNELIGLWARGASELIRLPPRTAAVAAEADRPGGDPTRVGTTWKLECDASWTRFGLTAHLSSLTAATADPQRSPGGPSAFSTLARAVFDPLLDEEGRL